MVARAGRGALDRGALRAAGRGGATRGRSGPAAQGPWLAIARRALGPARRLRLLCGPALARAAAVALGTAFAGRRRLLQPHRALRRALPGGPLACRPAGGVVVHVAGALGARRGRRGGRGREPGPHAGSRAPGGVAAVARACERPGPGGAAERGRDAGGHRNRGGRRSARAGRRARRLGLVAGGRGSVAGRGDPAAARHGQAAVGLTDLTAAHDALQPPGEDEQWSDSLYFGGGDARRGVALYTRVGRRPNEGRVEGALGVWLPGGRFLLAFARAPDGGDIAAGPVAFECRAPFELWRLSIAGRGRIYARAEDIALAPDSYEDVELGGKLRFACWTDPIEFGSGLTGAVAHRHYEQPGSLAGAIVVGDERIPLGGAGVRDHSGGGGGWASGPYRGWV